ncbi:MAG: trigger factor [Firmicutes bacterium]|nr:trigger factor [Bacillota bacterium]
MKPVLVSKENNIAKFTMAFTTEEFDAALDKAYKAQRGKIEVPGFRKGKAPRSVIEKRYGEGIFFEDAIDNCLADGYPAALDQLDLEPVDRPDLSFGEEKLEKGKGFEVTVTVTVAPEVVVKDYKGVKAEVTKRELNEEDIEGELKAMQQRNARLVVVDRPAEKDDTVVLDYEGWCEDKQFEGGTAENQTLVLGSGQFIPGFEDQLIGCKAGDAKDVEVTFPEEYHAEELAGKPAVFKCKIHEVKTQELPELDDEFAKDVSEFDTLEELKADTRAKLEKTLQDAKEYQGKDKVLQKVFEANPIDLPQAMIDDEAANMLNEFGYELQSQGMNLDLYCKYLNKTQQQMIDEFKPDAEKRVKSRLIVQAVAKQEGLEVSEEDINKELAAMAAQYGMAQSQIKSIFGEDQMGYLKKDILSRKAIDLMYEAAEITEVEEKKEEDEKPAKKAAKKKASKKDEE